MCNADVMAAEHGFEQAIKRLRARLRRGKGVASRRGSSEGRAVSDR
jgi:hypothetical protein